MAHPAGIPALQGGEPSSPGPVASGQWGGGLRERPSKSAERTPKIEGDRLAKIEDDVVACRACPRLTAWREHVAEHPRAAFAGQTYWSRPVAAFGDPAAELVVVGLAPAAHGGNRTGRMFTGDRSGDWLFRALWRAGFASQPTSVSSDDGLELRGAWVTAAVRCAPPDNRPTVEERDRCLAFLEREFAVLGSAVVTVALGGFAYDSLCRLWGVKRRPPFVHLGEVAVPPGVAGGGMAEGGTLLCSYHPSQRNTSTRLLTEPMFDAVFDRASLLCSEGTGART